MVNTILHELMALDNLARGERRSKRSCLDDYERIPPSAPHDFPYKRLFVSDDETLYTFFVPGYSKDEIELSLSKEGKVYIRSTAETRDSFERHIQLDTDFNEIEKAKCENGLLTFVAVRTPAKGYQKIKVN